jgi:hypothetical protein
MLTNCAEMALTKDMAAHSTARMLHDRELLLTALRVLSRIITGQQIPAHEATALRRQTSPEEAALGVDELCCSVIHRLLANPLSIRESSRRISRRPESGT